MKTINIKFEIPKLLETLLTPEFKELLQRLDSYDNLIRCDTDDKTQLLMDCINTAVQQTLRDINSLKEATK